MTRTPRLTSDGAACCWIPLFALRCETARRPELAALPVALVGPDDTRRVWQVSPLARHTGVKPGMTVSQAIGLCPTLKLCEPDPVHYDEQFSRLVATFLAAQPLAVLPLDPDTHRRLRQLGVKTLGALVALPEEAVVSQFGGVGRQLWRLAAGLVSEPVVGRVAPEPIVAALTFFTPVGERDLLAHALDKLVDRALGDPRRSGWRVQVVRVHAELEHGASWLVAATLKDPAATRERIAAPLKTQLERSPPAGAVERLVVEFTAFAPGTAELQLFARDAGAAARAGRRRALQSAAREIALRIRRPMLYHVIEVQPWSRLPERRYALIDFEP